jgi:hypothetical protein
MQARPEREETDEGGIGRLVSSAAFSTCTAASMRNMKVNMMFITCMTPRLTGCSFRNSSFHRNSRQKPR